MHTSLFTEHYEQIEAEVRKVFLGQEKVLSAVLVAMLARGHVLIEGVPGVGKTLLVRVLGRVLGSHFRRIQFTPDLMPSDVTGSTTYNSRADAFEFKHGPVFTHILLADEVNRAPAKTQSSMLEAMQERSVTVDGTTHPLPNPFFVLATQNPIESAGTYALPEAQLDRFLFKLLIEHPPQDVEAALLRSVRDGFDAADIEAVGLRQIVQTETLLEMQAFAQTIHVDDKIIDYITTLVGHTRRHRSIQIGASPRAAIALLQTARVEAAIQGRSFVTPDDVKMHGPNVLRHRLILQPDAEIEGVTTDEVIAAVLKETPVPGVGKGSEASAAPRSPSRRSSIPPPQGTSPLAPAIERVAPSAPPPTAPARSAGMPEGSGPSRPASLEGFEDPDRSGEGS